MKKQTLKQIMKNAWNIAAQAQEKFGGRKVDYIAEAMKQAWAEAKLEGKARQMELSNEVKNRVNVETMEISIPGSNSQPHWVAKVTDTDPKWKLKREFLEGDNRAWTEYGIEENVIYNFCPSRKYKDQYYFMIVDGIIVEYKQEEVIELLESK